MAVFRIEKTQNYTVMSNHHLRNAALSLKAKGLLSQMLSLPESWDYTLKGLSLINREKVEAIRTAVLELEAAGYITRRQTRDAKGKMSNIEYTIFEQPQTPDAPGHGSQPPPPLPGMGATKPEKQPLSPSCGFPIPDNPVSEKPIPDSPISENQTQLNKEETNKEKLNTDLLNRFHPFPFHARARSRSGKGRDRSGKHERG